MLDHVAIKVSDCGQAQAFYDLALAPLGLRRLVTGDNSAGYGDHRPYFFIQQDGPAAIYGHVAFVAADSASVDAFYAAALAAGARDDEAPGLRPYAPGYYAAAVLDPDGYSIEAVRRAS